MRRKLHVSAPLVFVAACYQGLGASPGAADNHTSTGGSAHDSDGGSDSGAVDVDAVWLPTRIRRLSTRELDNTVEDLLGTSVAISATLGSDLRQSGFTLNSEQRVDATFGGRLQLATETLAKEAVAERLDVLVPCASDPDQRACAAAFVDDFGTRAFRRPLTDEERDGLLAVYDLASTGVADGGEQLGTFAGGIEAIIRASLQSGSFLYLTELGTEGDGETLVELAPYETAAQISYLVIGAPPDEPLFAAAAADSLRNPSEREDQARRLLASDPRAGQQAARFVKEWLGIDRLADIDRESSVEETFATLRPMFEQETDVFIHEVLANGDGKLATMLTADFAMVNEPLAAFYGVPYSGVATWVQAPLEGTSRRGLLTQANFLSTYASNAPPGSSPVNRGKAVLNQMLCLSIEFPTDPEVAMDASEVPPADGTTTTRERFEQHSSVPACAACHKLLDGIGFAFENFDQVGKFRATENGKTIDASGELVGADVSGPYANASGLVDRLASSEQVSRCFARNFFRFVSGQTSNETESQYLEGWESLDGDVRDQLVELMVAYIRSDFFIKRRAM